MAPEGPGRVETPAKYYDHRRHKRGKMSDSNDNDTDSGRNSNNRADAYVKNAASSA